MEHVVRLLRTHSIVTTRLKLSCGRIIQIRKPSLPDAEQQRVYDLLGIDWRQAFPAVKAELPACARADMKLVVSGRFESGGFFRLAGDFSSPFRSRSFPFLCKKETMERPRATFMPVFPPHFQPAESIRVHAGPRIGFTEQHQIMPKGQKIGLHRLGCG